MARYCFYCGKQLDEGEKCNCRSQSYYSAAEPADFASKQKPESKRENTDNSAKSGSSASGKTYSGSSQNQSNSYQEKYQNSRKRPFFYRDKRQRRPGGTYRVPGLSSLAGLTAWVRKPSDKIREQALNSANKVPAVAITINLLILMLWFSLFYYRISLQFKALNNSVVSPDVLSLLPYSLGISVLFCFLESFFIWILLKLMERLPVTFIDVLRLSRSAYIYLTLFVLLAIGTVVTVPLASLAMVICGFMIAIYVHIRSLCHVYKMNGNNQIRLMVFTMIFFAASFTFAGQLIPVLIKISPSVPSSTIS